MTTNCSSDRSAIAQIGNDRITIPEYRRYYQNFLESTQLDDSPQYRFMVLESLIDEKLLLQYGRSNGFDKKADFLRQVDQMERQLLLNEVYDREIKHNLTPTESELRQMFAWSNTRIHTRHLFSRSRQEIDSIYSQLQAGISWGALANYCFQDSALATNGGDLGFTEMGDLDPAFETVAYSLKTGETSPPVKTQFGFSIIQVLEKEIDPFLTETNFQNEKKWLTVFGRGYRKGTVLKNYTDSVTASLGISFYQNGIKYLSDLLPIPDNPTREKEWIANDQPCVKISNQSEIWMVGDTWEKLLMLSTQQKKGIRIPEDIRLACKGLVVREHLLSKAREWELDQTQDYRQLRQSLSDQFLLKQVMNSIFPGMNSLGEVAGKPQTRNRYFTLRDSLRNLVNVTIDSEKVRTLPVQPVL